MRTPCLASSLLGEPLAYRLRLLAMPSTVPRIWYLSLGTEPASKTTISATFCLSIAERYDTDGFEAQPPKQTSVNPAKIRFTLLLIVFLRSTNTVHRSYLECGKIDLHGHFRLIKKRPSKVSDSRSLAEAVVRL